MHLSIWSGKRSLTALGHAVWVSKLPFGIILIWAKERSESKSKGKVKKNLIRYSLNDIIFFSEANFNVKFRRPVRLRIKAKTTIILFLTV